MNATATRPFADGIDEEHIGASRTGWTNPTGLIVLSLLVAFAFLGAYGMRVVTGDLIQQGVTHNDFSMTGSILAVGTFAFWASVLSWVTYLSSRAERILDGEPRVIVRDGEVLAENLRRDQLTVAELQSEMRMAGIGHMRDVAWAILEPKGKISFIERSAGGGEEPPSNPQTGEGASAV